MPDKTKKQLFIGLKEATPILLGYIPVGLAFGVLAKNSGLSNINTSLMSVFVFAGASQFIALELIEKGITAFSVVLTTFLVNSRHILMSASLSPYFKKINSWKSALLSFGITDETFALNSVELKKPSRRNQYYVFGVHVTAYIAWVTSTILGIYLGEYISNPRSFGLDFALPAMFIALLVIQVTKKIDILVIISSIFISIILLPSLGTETTLIFATLFASTLGALIEWSGD